MKNNETLKIEYSAVALGNFDGVHIGHRAVLQNAYNYCADKNIKPIALIFDVHPKNFGDKKIGLLMTTEDRKAEIKKTGLEPCVLSFEKVKDFSAEKFVKEILKEKLNAKAVFCGYNYHFGAEGKADVTVLEKLCRENDMELFINEEISSDEKVVSSSVLRNLLQEGKVCLVNKLMGREFSYCLEVVHGQKRGREMGFPTINQYFPSELAIPKFGVYASSTEVDGKVYRSFTNIGLRPTFPEDDIRSETHIFGFDGDLYGKKIRVKLHKFIREEKKFSSLKELVSQLTEDKKTTEEIFSSAE